jgi:uncharacterized protein YcaQ
MFGYFALPVLVGEEIVAVVDLKADRERSRVLIQQWTWLQRGRRKELKKKIDDALHRFEHFQLGRELPAQSASLDQSAGGPRRVSPAAD